MPEQKAAMLSLVIIRHSAFCLMAEQEAAMAIVPPM